MSDTPRDDVGRGRGTVTAGPYEVSVEYLLEPGGVPEITAYAVRDTTGNPIPEAVRRDLTRQLPQVADYVHANVVAEQARHLNLGDGTLTLDDGTTTATAEVHNTRMTLPRSAVGHVAAKAQADLGAARRRRHINAGLKRQVAEVYLANVDTGAPTKAVADHFHVSAAQASRYVKAARDAGLIPPLES